MSNLYPRKSGKTAMHFDIDKWTFQEGRSLASSPQSLTFYKFCDKTLSAAIRNIPNNCAESAVNYFSEERTSSIKENGIVFDCFLIISGKSNWFFGKKCSQRPLDSPWFFGPVLEKNPCVLKSVIFSTVHENNISNFSVANCRLNVNERFACIAN